ncbi:MAG: hypothetical protein WBM99_03150 [Psychromonas sp.]
MSGIFSSQRPSDVAGFVEMVEREVIKKEGSTCAVNLALIDVYIDRRIGAKSKLKISIKRLEIKDDLLDHISAKKQNA